jgi:capsular exopolysaccharide synthesis family protein
LELREYFRVLRSSWVLISIIVICALGATSLYTILKAPEYVATTKVFVSAESASSVTDLTQGNTFTQQVVQSYTDIVTTPIVLHSVVNDLSLGITEAALAKKISASAAVNTVVIQISVTDKSADTSAAIANSVASSLTRVVSKLSPSTSSGTAPVKVTIVQKAQPPLAPSSPNVPLNIALGLVVGLILGVAAAVIRSLSDTRIRDTHDISAVTDAPVLGGIAFDSGASTRPLIVQDDPRSPRAESFRSLRTNLQFLEYGGRPQSFVFTSPLQGEGKTTTVANLAIALTDNGMKVVVVDADLRRPRLAEVFGLEGAVGLSDVLIGLVSLDDALQEWGTQSLKVLPAGQKPPNPSELLGSQSMADIINTLTEWFDIVLVDAPPLLPVTDAAILSKRTGGAIVMAAAGKTHRAQLKSAMSVLSAVGATPLGVVMTMLPVRSRGAVGYGNSAYGYGYGYEDEELSKKDRGGKARKANRGQVPSDESTSQP